jgi:hypothetical protein
MFIYLFLYCETYFIIKSILITTIKSFSGVKTTVHEVMAENFFLNNLRYSTFGPCFGRSMSWSLLYFFVKEEGRYSGVGS